MMISPEELELWVSIFRILNPEYKRKCLHDDESRHAGCFKILELLPLNNLTLDATRQTTQTHPQDK